MIGPAALVSAVGHGPAPGLVPKQLAHMADQFPGVREAQHLAPWLEQRVQSAGLGVSRVSPGDED